MLCHSLNDVLGAGEEFSDLNHCSNERKRSFLHLSVPSTQSEKLLLSSHQRSRDRQVFHNSIMHAVMERVSQFISFTI